MATAILRRRFEEMGLADEIEVISSGVYAEEGNRASPLAVTTLAERGMSLENHRSQPMTPAQLQKADIVLVMEESHRRSAFYLQPQHLGKVYLLTELVGRHDDIKDPFGRPAEAYERTVDTLERLIDAGMPRLLQLLKVSAPTVSD
jgi:protein-tyrosine-phosphatase